MADNITITPGTGENVSFDEISTLNGNSVGLTKVQRVKATYGVDGSAQDVTPTTGMPIQGSQSVAQTTSWTSATAANTSNTISITGMNTVSVAVVATTTITGGVLTFEVSADNTNWLPITMAPVDRIGSDLTYTIVASTSRGWSTSVDGFTNFRVRLSTVIAGTGSVGVVVIPQTFAIEPIVNAGVVTRTTGGLTPFTLISAATTNATAVKTSPGTIYSIQASNTGTANAFLKLYNKASAPTVGTDVAVKTLIIPANSTSSGGIVVSSNDIGIGFSLGIALAVTALAPTGDTTAVAASQVVVNIDYA